MDARRRNNPLGLRELSGPDGMHCEPSSQAAKDRDFVERHDARRAF